MTSPRLQAAIDRAKYLAERSARNKRSYEVKIARHAEFEEALGPCGCDDNDLHDDYPDFLRALNAIRRAKVTA